MGRVSPPIFGIIVVLSVATALVAPPLIRMAFGTAKGEQE
jgi:hypothetical protein